MKALRANKAYQGSQVHTVQMRKLMHKMLQQDIHVDATIQDYFRVISISVIHGSGFSSKHVDLYIV